MGILNGFFEGGYCMGIVYAVFKWGFIIGDFTWGF